MRISLEHKHKTFHKFLKLQGGRQKEAMKVHLIDSGSCGYPITGIQLQKSSNWIPVIGHPHDCVPNMLQIGTQRTITIGNFVIDTITIEISTCMCSVIMLSIFDINRLVLISMKLYKKQNMSSLSC